MRVQQAGVSIVLVGRKNVGKSTLFNRLSDTAKSLTLNYAGVTRDAVVGSFSWRGGIYQVIDTGGIEGCFSNTVTDGVDAAVRQKSVEAMKSASLIIFVCDGTVGVQDADRDIARYLRQLSVPVLLTVNKIDNKRSLEFLHEFDRLGISSKVMISAQHGSNMSELYEHIVLQAAKIHESESSKKQQKYTVALLGRPNVGKSSLMNCLMKKDRSIVANIPGTTRESIADTIRFFNETISLVDTPGIRRKRGVTEEIEQLMVGSAFQALSEADIILFVIDVTAGAVVDQELKLAFYAAQEKYKAVVLLVNKTDLLSEQMAHEFEYSLQQYPHLMKRVKRIDISCVTGKNIGRVLPEVDKIWQKYSIRLSDADLTTTVKEALTYNPLYKNGVMMRVKRIEQIGVAPMKLIVHVNCPVIFDRSHVSRVENIIRKRYQLTGVPIHIIVKK